MWSQWCPHCRGSTVQGCLLWSQWCPHYRGSIVQDCLQWSQWCPHYKGSTVQDCLQWFQWCPHYRGSIVCMLKLPVTGTQPDILRVTGNKGKAVVIHAYEG